MKRIGAGILCLLLIAMMATPVLSEDSAPADCFTHWELPGGQKKAVAMRPIYEAVKSVTARSLGLQEDIGTIEDLECDEDGNAYILTDSGRIFCFDSAYKLVQSYAIAGEDGTPVDIAGARGICVTSAGEFYIADTENARVLFCVDGIVRQTITLPPSALIPSDFVFKPVKAVRDSKGYLYVLSEGSYYGAVLYDPKGGFAGFFGANTVRGTVLSTLSYLWDRLTQNDVKRAKTRKVLPYQFSDIFIDDADYVYTCTGMNDGGAVGQIRVLTSGGANILPDVDNFNFGESDQVKRMGQEVRQNFVGVLGDGQGFIYALDKTYGLIYLYDTERNMIAAFGGGSGLGRQTGVFSSACAIALSGDRLMVADSLKNSVTVFKRTAYGDLLLRAQERTLKADHEHAKPLWEQVCSYDSMNRLALRGLAQAAYAQGDYESAVSYAKAGGDTDTYRQARAKVQNAFIAGNFVWLFSLAVLLLAGLTALVLVTTKRQVVFIKNAKLRTMTRGMLHPFQSFNDVKYKQMGSMRIALVLTGLFFLTGAASVTWSDTLYTHYDASTYNSLFQILQTVGLVALWSVANWGVSTLQDGKGRLREVFTVSAYSTLPLILYNVIAIPLTYFATSPDSALIGGLHTLALILTGIMLCVGLMVIHDFSFPRFLVSAFITVLFMILIVFVLFMAGMLLTQFWSFLQSITMEMVRWR